MWIIESVYDNSRMVQKSFDSIVEAESYARRMSSGLPGYFRVVPEWIDQCQPKLVKMLREGMVKGDLRGILLPKLSVDQYLPSDPKSDNVVLAWFIKGVPEAVLPLKNYVDHCDGVVDVDYGDSESIPNCSIVYVEMIRDKLNVEHIHRMIEEIARLAALEPEDFTLTFPTSDDKYPYSPEILDQFFRLRTEEANRRAQDEVISQQTHKGVDKGVDQGSESSQIATEAMIQRLVGLFG